MTKTHPVRFYFGLYRAYGFELVSIFLLYAVKHGVWLVFPFILKYVIDDYIPNREIGKIFLTIPVVVVLGAINLLTHVPCRTMTTAVVKKTSRDLRNLVISKLHILSVGLFSRSETGRYYSKIMVDVTKAEHLGQAVLGRGLAAFFSFVYSIGFVLVVQPILAPVMAVLVASYVLIYRAFSRSFNKHQHRARMADEDLSQAVNQFIQTSILSHLHGEEDFEKSKVERKGSDIVAEYRSVTRVTAVFNILIATSSQIFQILAIAIGAVFVIRGSMTIGVLILAHQYMREMIHVAMMVVDSFPELIESAESIRSVGEILDTPDIERNEGKRRVNSVHGAIEFLDVSFSYDAERPVIRNVSLDIEAGTTIALVGPSGSGKSTFVNLALGLLRPQRGTVLVDGSAIDDLDMRSVRRFVGVVTQRPILFRGTVAENIAHARPNAGIEEIREAATMANADGFISQLDGGYDALIGEGGATLSGGQQQRIAIARAILRRPSILVLDEATSALDSIAEQEVQVGVASLLGRQTTLIIAHRLSTIRQAETIVVLENGAVIESGSHSALLAGGGLYSNLYAMQLR